MKRLFCVFIILIMLFSFCSCNDNAPQTNEYQSMKTDANKESVDEFTSLLDKAETEELLSGYTFDEEHCYNVTPEEIATETDMKIFKFSDSYASFVMLENEIYPLCQFFGGVGFVNAVPCDFDNDGNKDLLVASSWGSGMHRSIISVFNTKTKESTVVYDTSETDTPNIDLSVDYAFDPTQDSDSENIPMYYSVYAIGFDENIDDFLNLKYTATSGVGYIVEKDGKPLFQSKYRRAFFLYCRFLLLAKRRYPRC